MLGIFSAVSNVFKVSRSYDKVNIDNACAKLNYRVTPVLLVVFTAMVCAQQYIGSMINCVQSGSSVPTNVLDTYCFYFGTYTHKKKLDGVPFEHLIGPEHTKGTIATALRLNSYYQWIPFYLFGLSLSFYFCHYIWKYLEGGNLRSLLCGLRCMSYSCTEIAVGSIPSTKERQEKVEELSNYLYLRLKSKLNVTWTLCLLVCEFFTFLHALGACWLTDIFVGDKGNFWKIYSLEEFLKLFPTVSKCTFRKYGPSGGIQNHDALCLLNMNYIAGRVFLFLRWWFPIVAAISALAILWRIVALCGFKFVGFNRLVNSSSHHNGKEQLKDRAAVLSKISYFDWIYLCYLGGNVDPLMFQEVISNLAARFKKPSAETNGFSKKCYSNNIAENQPTAPPYTSSMLEETSFVPVGILRHAEPINSNVRPRSGAGKTVKLFKSKFGFGGRNSGDTHLMKHDMLGQGTIHL